MASEAPATAQVYTSVASGRLNSKGLNHNAAAAASCAPAPQQTALNFDCLNGLRALGSIAVVVFHCFIIWEEMVPFETSSWVRRGTWAGRLATIGGSLAVDFFLIVAACLATYQLLPALEQRGKAAPSQPSCGRVVLHYLRRRALRLLPAYAATNLLIAVGLGSAPHAAPFRALAFSNCPSGLWRNALFITHTDVSQACGKYLWSLSLQVQIFIAAPLLLWALQPRTAGFRTRLAVSLSATVVGGTAWRLWRVASFSHLLHLPLGDLTQPAEAAANWNLLHAAHFPTGTRVAEVALGALLGLLLRWHAAVSWLLRRRTQVGITALALQAVYLHSVLHCNPHGLPGEQKWHPLKVQLYAVFMYYGSPLLAVTTCMGLMALMLHSDPMHAALSSGLSSPLLTPLSKLSYCVYLVAELARLWGVTLLVPAGVLPALIAVSPYTALMAICLFTLACSYACAFVLHHLVEKPFFRWL